MADVRVIGTVEFDCTNFERQLDRLEQIISQALGTGMTPETLGDVITKVVVPGAVLSQIKPMSR